MLSKILRPHTLKHIRALPIVRRPGVQTTRPLNTNSWIEAAKQQALKVSGYPFRSGSAYGIVCTCIFSMPLNFYESLRIIRGEEREVRKIIRQELRNVRVIFEDQAQWKQEEERDLLMKVVNQDGMPLEWNFMRARVSDDVASLLAKQKGVES